MALLVLLGLGLPCVKIHQLNFYHFAMKDVQKKAVLGNSDRCPNSRISPWLLFDMAHNRSWPGFCAQRVRGVPFLFFILPNITPERAEKLESPVNSRKCCRCWRSWSWDLWRFLLVQTVLLFRGEQCTRWGSLRIVVLRSLEIFTRTNSSVVSWRTMYTARIIEDRGLEIGHRLAIFCG